MLLGIEDSEPRSRPAPHFWEAYEKFRQEFDLVELGIDLRDPYPGRDFEG